MRADTIEEIIQSWAAHASALLQRVRSEQVLVAPA